MRRSDLAFVTTQFPPVLLASLIILKWYFYGISLNAILGTKAFKAKGFPVGYITHVKLKNHASRQKVALSQFLTFK
jgi:hypothetical protein